MAEFHSEEIEVRFGREPLMEKKPGLPSGFTWRGQEYVIVELLKEWHDYRLRGRTKGRYEKERGSWGVGRDYYRVRTQRGELFDIYYDRAPIKGRKGSWVLYRRVGEDTT